MKKREVFFAIGSFAFLALAFGLLVSNPEPNPGNVGFFSNMKGAFGKASGIGVGEYFRQFFSALDGFGWVKFVLGVFLGVFIYIGIPTLVGKFGGEGWK
jgi:hypothetical protein